jgi:hypothetical protein
MGYLLPKMAMMMAVFRNPDIPMEGKCEDTSATRKARKERARELTRQREQELREKKNK